MSLLRDIQNAAVDPNTDVATLLRKCKILAMRLGNEEFKHWVDRELSGYENRDELPEYRILSVESFGFFSGSFNSGLENAPIPPSCLPEEYRDFVSHSYLIQPISAYAALLDGEDKDAGNFQENWPADLIARQGQKIFRDMNCLSAWKMIPRGSVVALIDTIKNKVLDFVLQVEEKAPDAGEAAPSSPPLPQETIQQIFNTYIMGDAHNVASGSGISQIAVNQVNDHDFASLAEFLASQGVAVNDIRELEAVIQVEPQGMGEKVQAWMGKMISKAASGAWTIGTSAAGTVLTKALSKYYGIE